MYCRKHQSLLCKWIEWLSVSAIWKFTFLCYMYYRQVLAKEKVSYSCVSLRIGYTTTKVCVCFIYMLAKGDCATPTSFTVLRPNAWRTNQPTPPPPPTHTLALAHTRNTPPPLTTAEVRLAVAGLPGCCWLLWLSPSSLVVSPSAFVCVSLSLSLSLSLPALHSPPPPYVGVHHWHLSCWLEASTDCCCLFLLHGHTPLDFSAFLFLPIVLGIILSFLYHLLICYIVPCFPASHIRVLGFLL